MLLPRDPPVSLPASRRTCALSLRSHVDVRACVCVDRLAAKRDAELEEVSSAQRSELHEMRHEHERLKAELSEESIHAKRLAAASIQEESRAFREGQIRDGEAYKRKIASTR